MNKKVLILPVALAGILLAGCSGKNSTTVDQTIRTVSLKGAPALALASEINQTTYKLSNESVNELKRSNYDVVIADPMQGFANVLAGGEYVFDRIITCGDVYLAKTGANQSLSTPSATSTILAYGRTAAIGSTIAKLNEKSVLPGVVTFAVDQAAVIASASEYDYVIVDALTYYYESANLTIVGNLNNMWGSYTETVEGIEKQAYIPQSVAFASNNAIAKKEDGLKSFAKKLEINVNNGVAANENLETMINSYSKDLDTQKAGYGFDIEAVKSLQAENANKLGLMKAETLGDDEVYMKNFLKALEVTEDYSTCFLASEAAE